MTNPAMPFMADPSDPGIGKDDDPVRQAADGHGDSVSDLGSEVGEASDDDVNHWIASSPLTGPTSESAAAE